MFAFDTGICKNVHVGPRQQERETMATITHKPTKNSLGDYDYRGMYIMRGYAPRIFFVARQYKNGAVDYTQFNSLKAACAFVDLLKAGE